MYKTKYIHLHVISKKIFFTLNLNNCNRWTLVADCVNIKFDLLCRNDHRSHKYKQKLKQMNNQAFHRSVATNEVRFQAERWFLQGGFSSSIIPWKAEPRCLSDAPLGG